ncbi:hypothetical protein Scep_009816 [Stephania cephalantha]|uniref:Uncharacterized protein n=1 Tax=Stephania cephalantha TaxID=152367 RepID=A0AAP0JUX0_9MAGN
MLYNVYNSTLFLVHLATIPITRTSINPAWSLGAAIVYNRDQAWDDHGTYPNNMDGTECVKYTTSMGRQFGVIVLLTLFQRCPAAMLWLVRAKNGTLYLANRKKVCSRHRRNVTAPYNVQGL